VRQAELGSIQSNTVVRILLDFAHAVARVVVIGWAGICSHERMISTGLTRL
jgi:hypothetical protein